MNTSIQHQLLQRKNLAYIKMKELREKARLAQIEFDLASKDLEEHKIQLTIKRMADRETHFGIPIDTSNL
jgi:predicted metal-dependent hydrolase